MKSSSAPRTPAIFPQLTLDSIRTVSVYDRPRKVTTDESASVFTGRDDSFDSFASSMPNVLAARDLATIVDRIIAARLASSPCVWMLGAHVIKTGLAPIIIGLIEEGFITAVAMNSAASIHDVESALFGFTSEDVAANLSDGSFGMARETGEFINGTLTDFSETDLCGYGEALGKKLLAVAAPKQDASILAACVRTCTPASVHAAIGTDIVHQQPTMDAAATGEMTYRDFKVLCAAIKNLDARSVVLNVGSAVVLPEVFLKALTVVRNLGYDARGFTTANFDMIQHYRPRVNVVERPTMPDGEGFRITGHHEIMIPLLAAMIRRAWMKRMEEK